MTGTVNVSLSAVMVQRRKKILYILSFFFRTVMMEEIAYKPFFFLLHLGGNCKGVQLTGLVCYKTGGNMIM